MADGGVRRLGGLLDLLAQAALQVGEVLHVGRDAGALAVGEDLHERQLEVAQQRRAAAALEVLVERDGEVGDGPRAQDGVGGVLVVLLAVLAEQRAVHRQLAVAARLGPQLAPQVAQRQVGQVEDALAGQGQVGRQRGVAGQPGDGPAAGVQRVERALGVVHRLGDALVGQPGGQRLLVLGLACSRST